MCCVSRLRGEWRGSGCIGGWEVSGEEEDRGEEGGGGPVLYAPPSCLQEGGDVKGMLALQADDTIFTPVFQCYRVLIQYGN